MKTLYPTTCCTTPAPTTTDGGVDYSQSNDEGLMIGIQNRVPKALECLFERYKLLLKSVILRIVHDHASADDVMQECMVEIWQHAGHYSATNGKPLGWIVTLCKRRAIDYLRRQQTYSNAKGRFENDVALHPFMSVQDGGADCEQADMCRVLDQQLMRLPPPQQQVLRLAFVEGMSQREVAQATHTALGTVKTRMELGLKKLRAAFRVSRTPDGSGNLLQSA